MKHSISFYTRMASVMLAFGFFFGCSSSLTTMNKARNKLDKKEYKNALNSINQEIKDHPGNPEAYYLKGNILFEMALDRPRPSNRNTVYEKMRSSLSEAHSLYIQQESPGDEVLSKNIRDLLKNSWNSEYRNGLAAMNDSANKKNNTEMALAHFNNAVTIIPDSSQPYSKMAEILYRSNRIDSAISTLQLAEKRIEELSAETHEQLAYLYRDMGQTDKAVEQYKLAKQKSRRLGNTNITHGLINAYISLGNHKKAVKLLDNLVSQNNSNNLYRVSYATELYYLASKKVDSLRQWIASTDHTSVDSAFIQNSSYKKLKLQADSLYSLAEEQFLTADSLQSTDPQVYYSIGIFYKNMALDYKSLANSLPRKNGGKMDSLVEKYFKNALGYFEKSVNDSTDNPNYWRNLYQLYRYFDMNEKAEKARKKANIP